MRTTLTIRNLDEKVKHKLRVRAATHGRSMEAEVRDILTRELSHHGGASDPVAVPSKEGKFAHLAGIWKGRMSTDEVMQVTRGE